MGRGRRAFWAVWLKPCSRRTLRKLILRGLLSLSSLPFPLGKMWLVTCVLMFHIQQDDFPVDTHVFEIAKAIGWVPALAVRNKTYLHLNKRIPDKLNFDLNCLLFTHGKLCRRCTKNVGKQQRKKSHDNSRPLLNYCKNF
ncbi:hypothetical protein CJ030_MR4G015724 [Morella rubra]|uniref:Uncharacterized protein n=1 Tax=Morella rubra TaxID=262757 RepID=A0A6A1VXP6_9ROSI|nr:hypothetical protein CJ030_MR4G015724 [Morella rubra]